MNISFRARLWTGCILLCGVTLAAYVPNLLTSDFVSLDDTLLITGNATIQELTPRSVFHAFTSYDPELYVPLTLVTYQLEHAVAGLTPQVYHFTNLLLHIASALVLFFLAAMILRSYTAGFFVALLFAIHPLNTEAVAWAAARKDVLSTFFFLLTLYLFERAERFDEVYLKKWSILTFLCALLSKVTVLPLVLILPLLGLMRGKAPRDLNGKCYWPYAALGVVFAGIAYYGKTKNLGNLSLWDYALIGCKSTVFYLGKIFWPVDFSVSYHQMTPVTLAAPEFSVPVVFVLVLVCVMLWMFWKRWIFPASCLLFFFLTVSVNFFNVWKNGMLFFASDRYAYIPAIGIFLLFGYLLTKLFAVVRSRTGAERIMYLDITLGILLTGILFPLTVAEAFVWQGSESLYIHALTVLPTSVMVLNNLGDLYVDEGKEDQGMALFLRAVESDPKNIVALTNIGNLYKKHGDLANAEKYYRIAAESVPKNPFPEHLMGLYLLGELQIDTGKTEEGLDTLGQAVILGGQYAEPYFNLGLMLEKLGRKDEAIQIYQAGVNVNGSYLIARYHLAGLLAEQGKLPEAITQLKAVVRLNPHYEKAAEHLANMEAMVGSKP